MVGRFEQERGSWVLARAGHRLGARRRGEKLMVIARRSDRYEVGAGDALFQEVTTRNFIWRSIFREEGAANTAGWALFTMIYLVVAAFVVGGAFVISRISYGIGWALVPKYGRMTMIPYIGLVWALGGLGALGLHMTKPEGLEAVVSWFVLAQLVFGLVWAAWLVRANGWAAVARREKAAGSGGVKTVVIDAEAPQRESEHSAGDSEPDSDEVEVEIAPVQIEEADEQTSR